MVKWINYIPLTVTLEEIDKKLGTILPKDLKNLILQFNKGMPKPNKFPLGNGKYAEFERLISFNLNENFTVYNSITNEMKAKNIIPFATTSNDNYICIKNSEIILYNVEKDIEKYLCNSLSELVNMLQE